MADLPTINAVNELKDSNEKGTKQLDASFVKGFSNLNKSIDRMANTLDKLFRLNEAMMQESIRDNFALMEKLREDARKKDQVAKGEKGGKSSSSSVNDLLKLLTVGAIVAAADAGVRGWEPFAIRKAAAATGRKITRTIRRVSTAVDDMFKRTSNVDNETRKTNKKVAEQTKKASKARLAELADDAAKSKTSRPVTQFIGDWFRNTKGRILGAFGLDPETGKPRILGGQGSFRIRISEAISERMQGIRRSLYSAIGLGVDGKPVVTTPTWVKEVRKKWIAVRNFGGTIADNVIEYVKTTFNSIKTWLGFGADATTAATKGPGLVARTLASLGRFLRTLPIIGQIVGAVMSIFSGLVAAISIEGTFGEKAREFFTTAIGDFFGAPLDLLKSLISWVMSKLGFENVEKFLDSFSFREIFIDMLKVVWDMGQRTIEWFGTLFSNPQQAIQELWDGVLGGVQSIGRWLKSLIPEDFDPLGFLGDKIKSILKWFYNSETGDIFGGMLNLDLTKFKESLPTFELPEFKMPDIKNPFAGIGDRIANAKVFDKMNFGNVLGMDFNIGNKMKNALAELFGVSPTQISGSGGLTTGALVDRASRQVAYDAFGNQIINVTPITSTSSNQQNVTNTTVAPASAGRVRRSPVMTDRNDVVYGN